eukprot:m.125889 g.125889  ORF g.125889 m.125889 type:complete len:70 (-) comp13813_c1_seq3:840-1049(-)
MSPDNQLTTMTTLIPAVLLARLFLSHWGSASIASRSKDANPTDSTNHDWSLKSHIKPPMTEAKALTIAI